MLDAWRTETAGLLHALTGSPATTLELIVLVAAGLVAITAVLRMGTALLGTPMSDLGRALQVMLLGSLITLSAVVAARLYVVPRCPSTALRPFIAPAAALLAVMGGAVTVSRAVHRGNYLVNSFAVLLAVTAAAAVVLLGRAAFDSFGAGEKRSEELRERREDLERYMQRRPENDGALARDAGAAC
ncbi:MAG: hypothetical protein FJ225_05125 [Lentisphaerae bacterium]|nr:hypothetical protein [Lentisphaerota bacterium]